ncbi:MAG TPA: hypothetical protein VFX60_18065 [Micromonospora sp.]|nr:hypothetical protein [Micromonospora sp.]
MTAAAALTVPGFFGEPWREALILAGFTLLVWVPHLPSLDTLNRLASVLASRLARLLPSIRWVRVNRRALLSATTAQQHPAISQPLVRRESAPGTRTRP